MSIKTRFCSTFYEVTLSSDNTARYLSLMKHCKASIICFITELHGFISDVIMSKMASQITGPASRLPAQPLVHAEIKENIRAPRYWPLLGEFTGDRWTPCTKGQWRGNFIHLMTSSCVCNITPPTLRSKYIIQVRVHLLHHNYILMINIHCPTSLGEHKTPLVIWIKHHLQIIKLYQESHVFRCHILFWKHHFYSHVSRKEV